MTSPTASSNVPGTLRPVPAPSTAGAASPRRRIVAQSAFEAKMILRNGEQLMVTILLPVMALVGLSQTSIIDLDTAGRSRIDFVTPGVIALAVMSAAFTSQAIATAFDRRNGVLRLMATTPLGRGGLLSSKIIGVLTVEAVQVVVISAVALVLGWRPDPVGIPLALLAVLLGTAAFTSLAMLLAGTLRAEGVLAVANIVLVLLTVGGAVLVPADQLPDALRHVALLLPSGALGEALRGAFFGATIPAFSLVVLLAWTAGLGWGAGKLFKWH
ncbi:ABC-2 type transport system permease protein [Sanguibacter gelidistatuariae]|uniref:ABC-2 type transport system permease protein n=1 Tax=Sanguibacter gelidistatuariae TaxID=1814289 RepID=A0A1G6TSQ4_9MICO|nr:ABC transporter permease [Sanguibacter gelidistatuariae]SDD32059.1 ABC-2 type transport system permease protein [Sanguibacter gelidistatuariae]